MTTTLKATFLSLAIIGTAFFSQAQKPIEGIAIGNKAPELAFTSPEGKTIALSSLKGKIVLIDFWA